MSIALKILTLLYHPRNRYIGLSFDEISDELSMYRPQSILNAFSKLTKTGFMHRNEERMMILMNGQKYVESQLTRLAFFHTTYPKNSKRNLLVLFDIPVNKKAHREWFRSHLKQFGYEMIQQSVWLGPSPLPKDFLQYVETIGLATHIKMFVIAQKQKRHLI